MQTDQLGLRGQCVLRRTARFLAPPTSARPRSSRLRGFTRRPPSCRPAIPARPNDYTWTCALPASVGRPTYASDLYSIPHTPRPQASDPARGRHPHQHLDGQTELANHHHHTYNPGLILDDPGPLRARTGPALHSTRLPALLDDYGPWSWPPRAHLLLNETPLAPAPSPRSSNPTATTAENIARLGAGFPRWAHVRVVHTQYHLVGVELRRFGLERYKGFARHTEVELAPLTILVGPNNSGKTALAQAVPLLAGGLAPFEGDAREPLPLQSCGIRHGESFEDLVTLRAAHGWLRLSISLGGETGESSLSATVRSVVAPGRTPARQISDWRLHDNDREIAVERQGFNEASDYLISVPGESPALQPLAWRGLLPRKSEVLADWVGPQFDALETWAAGVRHLRCPRQPPPVTFSRGGTRTREHRIRRKRHAAGPGHGR